MPREKLPVLRRDIGSNAPDLICQLASSGYISAIQEFVANSYDADSETVDVVFDGGENSLTIKDNGEGMDLGGGSSRIF